MAIPFTPEDFKDEPIMLPGAPGNEPPADIIDQMAQVREEQARSLQEHMEYRSGLEQKQKEVDLRAGDLDVSERLLRVFDTTLPKPFREFELRGLSRHLGIDPKGDSFKDISKVVMGLDPDSSMAVKEAFTARMQDATPGQVSEFTRGILQGKVPISQLAGMVREHQVAQAQTTITDGAPTTSDQQGKVDALFARQQREFKPQDVIAQQGSKGAAGGMAQGNIRDGIQSTITQRESDRTEIRPPLGASDVPAPQVDPNKITVEGPAPSDNRVVDPSIAAALGYDPTQTPSAEILARHPGIGGMDAKEQKEAAKKLAENRQYVQETGKLADKITQTLDIDPNTVPYTLPIIGRWVGTNINAAREVTSLEDARNAIRKAVFPEGVYEYYKKHQIGKTDEETRETAKKAQELMNNLTSLAYMSAKSKDPSGRLSDQDLQLELRALGAESGSADLLRSALKTHVDSMVSRYGSKIQTETGGPAVDPKATGAVIQRTSQGPTDVNGAGQTPSGQTPAPVDPRLRSVPDNQQQKTENPTPTQQAQERRSKEQAKDTDEQVQQARRRFELEQAPVEARLRLEAAQRDEARLQLAMEQAKEQKEWREYQKLKDQRAEARREREKIQAAFAQFARAMSRIGGGIGLGGTPSMGADQDAGAFKIAPGAGTKRAPPSPGQTQPSHQYTYTGRRRQMEK